MNWFKKLISNNTGWIFAFYLVLHIFLLNINFAEWGDSYRILRASEHIRNFSYPEDEKRPPLFSVFLALRPNNIDQITWGRVEMLIFSLVSFYIFYLLLKEFKLTKFQTNLGLLIFCLNPVYLYWSLRIYADTPFTFLVMLTLFLFKKWEDNLTYLKTSFLGFLLGLAVLTRFEGYILGFSLGLGFVFFKNPTFNLKKFFANYKHLLVLGLSFVLSVLPWILYRNPFESSYFSEPAGRAYDLRTVFIYIVSLFFAFGFTSAPFFLFAKIKGKKLDLQSNLPIFVFVVIELFLALVWPAAIPRLLVPVIPFLIIYLTENISDFFETKKVKFLHLILMGFWLGLYFVAQYFLRLQFLVLQKNVFIFILFIQVVNLLSIYFKKKKLFVFSLFTSMFIWSLAVIYLHKDLYKSVVMANKYVSENLSGNIAYNDVSSVSDWYLNEKNRNALTTGVYINMDNKKGRNKEVLLEKNVDYVIITNEHNTSMEFDLNDLEYLEQIKEFRYTISGKEFFAKVLKFNK